MLTGIGLRNFKAFGDEMQEAPLSKITLIYGPNSGGKSSMIQALLLLKQSLKNEYDIDRTLAPVGDFVDLGTSLSILHKHDKERELGISLKYRNAEFGSNYAENHVSMLYRLGEDNAENEVSMEYVEPYSYGEDSHINLLMVSYKITSDESDIPLLDAAQVYAFPDVQPVRVLNVEGDKPSDRNSGEFLPILTFPELKQAREYILDDSELKQPELESFEQSIKQAVEQQQRQRRVQALEQKGTVLQWTRESALEQALVRAQKRMPEHPLELGNLNLSPGQILDLTPENIPYDYECHLRQINYLGPLRIAPERLYRLSNVNTNTVGVQGEYSANVLYQRRWVLKKVQDWFKEFEIPYLPDVKHLGEARIGRYINIALWDIRTEVDVTLADVGYGINQILPVIIEGVASQEGSILCVEQPEIHLHPRLQANIADLMIDTIADEDGKRKQWIVETHSELLILRLQRRIREGKIKPEDISVLYVDPNDDSVEGSAIKVLRLGDDSYFKDLWPDGFFDDALTEELEPDDERGDSAEGADVLDKLFAE